MTEEEKLKIRIEGLIKNPSISKKVLFEIDQYFGKQLLGASIKIKTKEPSY
jgi:hypothetical protein